MPGFVRDGFLWREATSLHVRDGSVWRELESGHVRDGSVWREFYTSGLGDALVTTFRGVTGDIGWADPITVPSSWGASTGDLLILIAMRQDASIGLPGGGINSGWTSEFSVNPPFGTTRPRARVFSQVWTGGTVRGMTSGSGVHGWYMLGFAGDLGTGMLQGPTTVFSGSQDPTVPAVGITRRSRVLTVGIHNNGNRAISAPGFFGTALLETQDTGHRSNIFKQNGDGPDGATGEPVSVDLQTQGQNNLWTGFQFAI